MVWGLWCRRVAVGVVLLAAAVSPARAVVILESTWEAEGGTKKKPWAGFGAHMRLAAEPQFGGVVALATDGESWGEASGTWIGNDANHAYILTAAHIFELPAETDAYVVRTPTGAVRKIDHLWLHPKWNGDVETRSGYDLAILRLRKPMTDAGAPPRLYTGQDEMGKLITFVGFGSRGIGRGGEKERYERGSEKAAAQGLVEEWVDLDKTAKRKDDAGNYLGIWLPKEDGSVESPYGGKRRKPATPLVGLLGAGDSGGSAWMQTAAGWVIVGINSNGDGNARYGEQSWFTRVSPHRDWITSVFPGAQFDK